MKITRKKILFTTLLAVVLVIAFGWVVMTVNHAILVRNHAGDETLKLDEVARTLEDIETSWDNLEAHIRHRYEMDATLSALALRDIVAESGDAAIAMHSNGAVIKITDGKITAPEQIEQELGLGADLFGAREGLFQSPENPGTLVVYSSIDTPYYYVEWHEDTSIRREVEEAVDIPGILRKAEVAYNVYALCVSEDASEDPDPEGTGKIRVLYSSDHLADLQETFLRDGLPAVSVEETGADSAYKTGTLSLENGTFRYAGCAIPRIRGYLTLLSVQPNLYIKALSQSTYMFAALIVILAGLLTAGFSLYFYVRRNELTPALEERYRPSNVRRFAILCGLIGAVLIFLSGLMIYALSELYDRTSKGKERLRMVADSLEMYTARAKQDEERFMNIYLDYGTHIAEYLDNYPTLREKPVLQTLADTISASSITLYDADGKQTISSGDYIGQRLSADPHEAASDFRRILGGTPSIVHGPETDAATGLNEIRIGLRIRDGKDPDRYGAMLICVDPALLNFDVNEMTRSVLRNLAGADTVLCIVSSETGQILSSSSEELSGAGISALGLSDQHLKGSLIKNTTTDRGAFFITSAELNTPQTAGGDLKDETLIAYCAAVRSSSSAGMLCSALTGCLLFIAIYALLAWVILRDYTDEFYLQSRNGGPSSEEKAEHRSRVCRYLSSNRPERTGLITMELVVALYLTQQIPIANFSTGLSQNSVYYYITSGQWEKGLNLFALAAILILLGQILLAVILIRLVLSACAAFTGPKGKTIFRLIRSLVMYVALFAFLIIACTYIGISMAVILTAIGTLGIAVSLGAQDFVSDIIAGLTIVFEGTCHVGDIVDLGVGGNEYHGAVREIGLRFIRIQTRDGNIVTLSNRDISMVNNMTQLNSRYICEFEVSSEYPIEAVEEMLKKELPKIGAMDRRILAGPVYNGIISLGSGLMTLSVTTECREQDLDDVRRLVNGSLERIFTQNGFRL